MSRAVRKPDFCLCKNKGADQLCSYCTADQRLCFRYRNSSIPPLFLPKIFRLLLSSVTVQASLCQTWLETQIVGFSRVTAQINIEVPGFSGKQYITSKFM